MYRLLSISDDAQSLKKFDGDAGNIANFLTQHGLDGLELMRWEKPQSGAVPMEKVIGRHMPYWPIFLDYWRQDKAELLRQFGTEENCRGYYFADSKEDFIQARRNEVIETVGMGVSYAVFHISHAQLEHCYTGGFTYSDSEILDAYIELINGIFTGVPTGFTALFENHWLPGLTFLDGGLAMRFLERVKYPKKGFVLDISHLMNTNGRLTDEKEAVRYILKKVEALGEAKKYIRAVHLNSSISGTGKLTGRYDPGADFVTRLISAMRDVGEMDPHHPFIDGEIVRVLEAVQPEYLVYELSAETLPALHEAVSLQNLALAGLKQSAAIKTAGIYPAALFAVMNILK